MYKNAFLIFSKKKKLKKKKKKKQVRILVNSQIWILLLIN
jgi:hypothetical protein